jgi:hypothetical protein
MPASYSRSMKDTAARRAASRRRAAPLQMKLAGAARGLENWV